MSINEIRELENMNPLGPEGDQHFIQLNMTTLEKVAAGDEEPQPEPAPEPVVEPVVEPAVEVEAEQEDVTDGD
jgi:hypothetical protein